MKRLWTGSLIALITLLLSAAVVHAQTSAPLIILNNGDLWSWREGETTLTRLSQSGYIGEIELSPDGTKLAYTELPSVVVDAIQRVGGFGGGALPADIWTMDLVKGTSQKVVAQPLGASFFTDNVPDKVTVRSKPVWSPDGFQLAWTEYDVAEDTQRLMVSDEAGRQPRIVVNDVEMSMGVTAPTPVIGWSPSGIALWNYFYKQGEFNNEQEVITSYTSQGELTAYTVIPQTEARFLNQVIALRDNNRDYVGIHLNTGEWVLVDQLTGTLQAATSLPERYSPNNPDSSLRVVTMDTGPNESTTHIIDAQGNPAHPALPAGFDFGYNIAFAPDGQALALRYLNTNTQALDPFITLVRNGQGGATTPTQVKGQDVFITDYVWGPMAWRLSGIPITLAVTAVPFDCPGAPPTRLTLGMLARVTFGGGSNNLRALAGRDGVKVGEIPEGGVFSVSEGPVCADGFVWWRVIYNNETGWTAEGDTSSYYVEPVQ